MLLNVYNPYWNSHTWYYTWYPHPVTLPASIWGSGGRISNQRWNFLVFKK